MTDFMSWQPLLYMPSNKLSDRIKRKARMSVSDIMNKIYIILKFYGRF
jgi:hypothetical protein